MEAFWVGVCLYIVLQPVRHSRGFRRRAGEVGGMKHCRDRFGVCVFPLYADRLGGIVMTAISIFDVNSIQSAT